MTFSPTFAALAAAGLATVLGAAPASAALIQFNFADPMGEPNPYDTSVHDTLSLSGQFTLDTGATGSFVSGNRYDFGASALVSFAATVTDTSTGSVVATLGFNPAVPAGIRVTQGYCCGASGGAGADVLNLDLVWVAGEAALTGVNGNFTLALATRSIGYSPSVDFVANLLYASSDALLDGIQNVPPIDRNNFDWTHPVFGWTGVTLTGLPTGNAYWKLETVSVQDVTPISAVPLPAAGGLLFGGLGVAGLLGRRRRA